MIVRRDVEKIFKDREQAGLIYSLVERIEELEKAEDSNTPLNKMLGKTSGQKG